jgi:hypothetical protein
MKRIFLFVIICLTCNISISQNTNTINYDRQWAKIEKSYHIKKMSLLQYFSVLLQKNQAHCNFPFVCCKIF